MKGEIDMRFESDYTKENHGEGTLAESSGYDECLSEDVSQKKLKLFLEYCRLRDSQFDIRPSQLKGNRIFKFYIQMKTLAFVNNGKVTLEIDEKKMKARLIYWGKSITLITGDSSESGNVLADILNTYELIYFEVEAGGIQICVEERLFDEVRIKDEETALLKIRQLVGPEKK